MTKKINTKIIASLNPCKSRFENWKAYYADFDGDICEFLDLPFITHHDKLWVSLRFVDSDTRIVFALDCTFSAYAYAYTAATAVNDNTAAAAAYAAAVAANANANTAAAYTAAAAAYAAVAATAVNDNTAAAYAADAAAYAADAAVDAAAAANAAILQEQDNQIKVLKYLIKGLNTSGKQ